jgi:hypothetical protein
MIRFGECLAESPVSASERYSPAGNNGSNPTYSFARSGTVNLLGLLKYLETTKGYFANPTLSTVQYGWEISSTNNTQEDFTINSYSVRTS